MFSGTLIREKLIFGKRIAFVPAVQRKILTIIDGRFPVRHGLGGKMPFGRIGCAAQNFQRQRIFRVGMRIDEAAHQFVVNIGWKAILDVEFALRLYGLREAANHAVDLGLAGCVGGSGVVARQRGHPLSVGKSGSESVGVVPSAQIFSRRGQSFADAVRPQQSVFA